MVWFKNQDRANDILFNVSRLLDNVQRPICADSDKRAIIQPGFERTYTVVVSDDYDDDARISRYGKY